jgi:ribosome-associated toxin RatA of RatAB toxin-antitoxin module
VSDGATSDNDPSVTTLAIHPAPDGRIARATARGLVRAARDRVWRAVADVEDYPKRLPMIRQARRLGPDRVGLDLRFGVTFLSVRFSFTAAVRAREGESLELVWESGEPRDLHLGFALADAGSGATLLVTDARFDPRSLGWLTKVFLKHHPEIEHGILPGVALSLLASVQRAVDGT